MMNYSELSDFEINKRVAEFDIGGEWFMEPTDDAPYYFYNNGAATTKAILLPDYCKDPSAIFPVMMQNNISLIYMGDYYWSATTDAKKYIKGGAAVSSIGVMPLRAVAIVYLMMQEQKA